MVNIKNLKILKYHIFSKKLAIITIGSKCGSKDEKIYKEEEAIKILKILGLINNKEQYQEHSWKKNKSRSYITAGTKKFKSTIKKKKNKHDKKVLLARTKLNTVENLISKALIDSSMSHDEFVSVNNMLKEYDNMKDEFINSNDK